MHWEEITLAVLRNWGERTHPRDLMGYLGGFLQNLGHAGPRGVLPFGRVDIYDPDYLRPYFRWVPEPGGTEGVPRQDNQHGLLAVVGFSDRRPRSLSLIMHKILAETLNFQWDLVIVITKKLDLRQISPFTPELKELEKKRTHFLFLQPTEDCSGFLAVEPQCISLKDA